jgi:hypothetical protein
VPEIAIFDSLANGNKAPKRVIAGVNTKLDVTLGLAVDSNGIYTGSWAKGYVERFAPGAEGGVAPRAVIRGSNTQLSCCLDGIITAPDGTVYVVDRGTPSILQFDGLAKGNVAPLTNISGPDTRLYIPLFVFVADQPS